MGLKWISLTSYVVVLLISTTAILHRSFWMMLFGQQMLSLIVNSIDYKEIIIFFCNQNDFSTDSLIHMFFILFTDDFLLAIAAWCSNAICTKYTNYILNYPLKNVLISPLNSGVHLTWIPATLIIRSLYEPWWSLREQYHGRMPNEIKIVLAWF